MERNVCDQQNRYGISRLCREVGDIVNGHFKQDLVFGQ